ncbi:MAG: hypothetical protein QM705_16060 [Ancrocorticia sp.]
MDDHHDSASNSPSAENLDTPSGILAASVPAPNSTPSTTATKRPAWLDILYGVVVGTGMFVVTLKTVPGMLIGVTVLAVVGGCTFAAERRFGARPPEVPEAPQGSDSKDFVRSLVFLGAAIAAGWYIFENSPEWMLWQKVSACAAVAAIASVYFLLEAMSQKRRISATATAVQESTAVPLSEPCP